MKSVICTVAFFASASAFAPQFQTSTKCSTTTTALDATSRREAVAAAGAAVAAFLPAAAQAATGESPRFSVFGLLGDGTSYSEGAAYGSDQSSRPYSPYSVYDDYDAEKSLYKPGSAAYLDRKKGVIAESKKRLAKLPAYIEKKQWFNVRTELDRYMYETRSAVRGLAVTSEQKAAAKEFFLAIEETDLSATLKKQEKCMAAAKRATDKLDAFTGLL